MKKFLKKLPKNKYPFVALLLLILVVGILVRFVNFSQRVNFGPEQARSLVVSGNYLADKFSLLGQEYFRVTSVGHKLFASSYFNYSLVPFLLLFKFQPVPITAFFAIVNIISAVLMFWVVGKLFNWRVAYFSLVLFLFNNYMIYHSLFIWILDYLPLISILSIFFALKYIKEKKIRQVFWLGLLSGLAFGLEYFYLLTIIIILGIIVVIAKKKIIPALGAFLAGGVIGVLPMLLFDVRHSFYHTKSLWQYFLDTLANPGQSSLTYYHFLNFWPIIILIAAIVLGLIYKKSKILVYIFFAGYIYLNLTSKIVSFTKPVGMLEGLNYRKVQEASYLISQDNPQNFNVVSLLDFDARGYILRYPLEFIYGKTPMGVEEYPQAKTLYVLVKGEYDFTNPKVWEISSFEPYSFELLGQIDNNYAVYKLTKK